MVVLLGQFGQVSNELSSFTWRQLLEPESKILLLLDAEFEIKAVLIGALKKEGKLCDHAYENLVHSESDLNMSQLALLVRRSSTAFGADPFIPS